MRKIFRNIILFVILIASDEIVFAQPFPDLHFQNITEKDGLSNNIATYITQDKQGFIWVGTQNGLNRFDGYRFKHFFHTDGDSTSLPGNVIAGVIADAKNNLWVSTPSGMACFNTIAQQCIAFKHHTDDSAILQKYVLPAMYMDTTDRVWATTDEGLYEFDKDLYYYKTDNNKIKGFQFYDVHADHYKYIKRDKKGRLWANIYNHIFLLDGETKKPVKTFIGPYEMNITNFYFDSDDRCWISTWGHGVLEFVPEKNEFRNVDLGSLSVFDSPISEWTVNDKRYILIGSDRYSFALLDPKTMAYKIYSRDGYQNNVLPARNINCFFVDRQNILWCATENGLSYITPSSTLYDIIPVYSNPEKKYDPAAASKFVCSFLHDETGNWVSSWFGGGIYRYDSSWKLKKHLPGLLVRKDVEENKTAFYMRKEGSEIYCTTDTGMFAIDTGNYRIRSFYPDDEKFWPVFRNIIPISKNLWWIRTQRSGIYVFDVAKGKFIKHYKHTEGCLNCLPAFNLHGMLLAKDSTIYITSDDGLYEYRPRTDDFFSYKRNEKDAFTFPTDHMNSLASDGSGNLWIGTENGICVFNSTTKKVEKLFAENKIMGSVSRVCVDDYQNVWFNSVTGNWCWIRNKDRLIHLVGDENFPKNIGDGLFINDNDGCVYNGCMDALVKYYPKKLMDLLKPAAIPIAVSEIIANNQFVPFVVNNKNEKQIILSAAQNSFTVDFAVLNYDNIKSNKYYYRLLPAVDQWQQNENGHLSFYELPPGNYRLEVKGGNVWTGDFPNIDLLLITVQPHWWQTWLFKLLSIIIFAAIIFLLISRRITNIQKEAAILQQQTSFKQKIAETEMQALRAQMNPHFIFNSLNSIENFMMKNDKRMASDYFNKFASLIRMILESSRNELIPFSTDIQAMQLYIDLEQLRFDNKFSYQTNFDPELLKGDYRVPSLLIQPYLENAIVHGIGHSDKEDLRIILSAVLENDFIKYTIEDNGVGRKLAAEYNLQNKPNHKSVGLQITAERINIFNESMNADSNVNIIDLTSDDNISNGTRVEIKIKAV